MNVYTSTVLVLLSVSAIQVGCESYMHYPNLSTLKNDAMYICCDRGSPIIVKEDAVKYYIRFNDVFGASSGIYNECCDESCSLEEVQEGYAFKSAELGEECVDEGCKFEELTEHCPHWV